MSLGNILVVDDTIANLQLLERLLSKQGYEVRTATGGQAALRTIAIEQPELILLDIMMTDLDGYQTCLALKNNPETAHIPVIFISAKGEAEDKVHGFEMGAVDYLSKPFAEREVLARIDTHLRLARSQHELQQQRDLLEQRVQERTAELSNSEAKFRSLIEQSSDLIWEISPDGSYRYISPNIEELLGYHSTQILDKNWLDLMPPDEAQRLGQTLQLIATTQQPFRNVVHRTIHHNGEIRYLETSGNPVFDQHGQLIAYLGVSRDISERQQYQATLEQRIQERTLAVSQANLKLRELDKLKSMFIASMSHELRTPLNSIIGFTGILLQGIIGELNAKQRDSLERVQRAGRHLLELISDVIDISKIEAGRINVHAEDFSLIELLKEATDSVTPQIKLKPITIDSGEIPNLTLCTDRQRVLQCILNYLSNAIKFTEQGHISVQAQQQGSYVSISIQDTGIGIAEADQSKLFEAFERLESHLRIKAGGTGLGLYLTKKIVNELLQGEIFMNSQLGQGSCFGLRIPIQLTSQSTS